MKIIIIFVLTIILSIMTVFSWRAKEEHQAEELRIIEGKKSTDSSDTDVPNHIINPTFSNIDSITSFEALNKYIYAVDESAYVTPEDLDVKELLSKNLKSKLQGNKPKILIFHTHSQEAFTDSRENEVGDTIVGVGALLAKILVNNYNINVVHDVGKYDYVNGKTVITNSYAVMEKSVQKILEKYPSIEVTIDLHRDGVPDGVRLVTDVDGMKTARLMFFNGISRLNKNGKPSPLTNLKNPYVKDNLALTLQLFLTSNTLYPGLARKIYIRPYRYSLHLLPKSMLIEVGANTNTTSEAKNAMYPLAEILVRVLNGS